MLSLLHLVLHWLLGSLLAELGLWGLAEQQQQVELYLLVPLAVWVFAD
jgi:NhaP-type Na+/H+ or K+/H+ antiporter